ncbi:hypothetical protein [Parasedimentitalea marina]|nr:hypothetical protein [Parasedimentitalea marina]
MIKPALMSTFAALGVASCCILPMTLMIFGVGGSWMAVFARTAAWAPLFIAVAASMTALAWGIAWRRHQVRRLIPTLAILTAMTLLAWGIWANEMAINDLLISWM